MRPSRFAARARYFSLFRLRERTRKYVNCRSALVPEGSGAEFAGYQSLFLPRFLCPTSRLFLSVLLFFFFCRYIRLFAWFSGFPLHRVYFYPNRENISSESDVRIIYPNGRYFLQSGKIYLGESTKRFVNIIAQSQKNILIIQMKFFSSATGMLNLSTKYCRDELCFEIFIKYGTFCYH